MVDADPVHEVADVSDALARGDLVVVAGVGVGVGVGLGVAGAALHVARLPPGRGARLPEAPRAHLLVALGAIRLAVGDGRGEREPVWLDRGDAARWASPARATHGPTGLVAGATGAEVLVWTLP